MFPSTALLFRGARATAAIIALALFCTTAQADITSLRECAAGLGNNTGTIKPPLGPELRIISWNIQKSGSRDWAQDLRQLAQGVELAFIQEAASDALIPEVLPETAHHSFAPGYRRGQTITGVMTLSSSEASLECDLESREPWLGTPKAMAITEYPLSGREERLLAINIHAVNFTFGLEDYRQQLDMLSVLIRQHRGPVLIAGDLNTWREGRVAAVADFMRENGLQAVAFSPDLRSTVFGQALDHILTRGLEASSANAVPVRSSDHNPLLVSLKLS